jgi:hypothetical protein
MEECDRPGSRLISRTSIKIETRTPRPAGFEKENEQLEDEMASPIGRTIASCIRPYEYARLLGVIVKEPFADSVGRKPSKSTHAVIGLEWKDDTAVRGLAPKSWQFGFVRALSEEEFGTKLTDEQVLGQLLHYKYESSLGKSIFEAFRKRICGNDKASKALSKAIAEAKKAGINLVDPTTAKLSVGLASVVAVAGASLCPPALAAVSAPVVGGIALLLIQVGVEGFCEWTKAVIEQVDDHGGQDE